MQLLDKLSTVFYKKLREIFIWDIWPQSSKEVMMERSLDLQTSQQEIF